MTDRLNVPRLTVLMPVYNGEAYLADAVQSILNQTYGDFEFIIIDDCSSDGTAEILGGFTGDSRVSIIRNQQNLRLARSLNRGLALARGKFIVRMDADDVSSPERLAQQVEWITKTEADVCFCRFYDLDVETGKIVLWRHLDETTRRWRVLFNNFFGPHPGVIFRKESILAVGGYDPDYERAEDYDLWDRCLSARQKLAHQPQALLTMRRHRNRVTQQYLSEVNESARSVSCRALRSLIPDLTEDQCDGLRWLILGDEPPTSPERMKGAVKRCRELAMAFLDRMEGAANSGRVWDDVATGLAVRLPEMKGVLRNAGRKCLTDATWRVPSLRGVARWVRVSALTYVA